MNLVGHHEAGMTSLATRLMGQEFREDVQSTGAISIHHLKSTFNINEDKMGKWSKTTFDSPNYMKDFSHAVLSRVKSIKMRKRRTTQKQKLPPPDKNVTNTKSGYDIEKPGEENSQQPKKLTTNSLGMNDSELNSDDQKKTNTTQDQTKPDTDKNRTQKQRGAKVELKMVTVGDSSIPSLNKQMTEEILSYKNTFLEKQPDDNCMSICLRDFGGQNDLFATHDIFLDAEATTLIVMDITKLLHQRLESYPKLGHPNTPAAVLHYWLNSIHVKTSQEHLQPNVALVLTHRDMIQDDNMQLYVEAYIKDILRTLQDTPYANFLTKDNIYVVDSKTGTDIEFQNLQNKLFEYLGRQSSCRKQVPIRWIKLKGDVIDKIRKEERRFLNFSSVIGQAKQYGISDTETVSFLRMENTLGNFIYFPDTELKEIIFTDPQWLVDKVTLITHHRHAGMQDASCGHITMDALKEVGEGTEVEFLKKLMVKFNLIIPMDEIGKKYILPSLLPQRNINLHQKLSTEHVEIYNELQSPKLVSKIFIGTFHQLVSECSKDKMWKLSTDENNPSYTEVLFDLGKETKLLMAFSKTNTLDVSIWCLQNVWKQDISKLVSLSRNTRHILSTKMEVLGITQADTYSGICPHSNATDPTPCLVQVKEYQHLSPNTFSYWCVKKKCDVHQKILQHTAVPSLLMLSSGNNNNNNLFLFSFL